MERRYFWSICSSAFAYCTLILLTATGCSNGMESGDQAYSLDNPKVLTQTLFDFTVANDRDQFDFNGMEYEGTYGQTAMLKTTSSNVSISMRSGLFVANPQAESNNMLCLLENFFASVEGASNINVKVLGGEDGTDVLVQTKTAPAQDTCSPPQDIFAESCGDDGDCPQDDNNGGNGDGDNNDGGNGNGDCVGGNCPDGNGGGNANGDGGGNGNGSCVGDNCPDDTDGGDSSGGCVGDNCPDGNDDSDGTGVVAGIVGGISGGCPPSGCIDGGSDVLPLGFAQPVHQLTLKFETEDGEDIPPGCDVPITSVDTNQPAKTHNSGNTARAEVCKDENGGFVAGQKMTPSSIFIGADGAIAD